MSELYESTIVEVWIVGMAEEQDDCAIYQTMGWLGCPRCIKSRAHSFEMILAIVLSVKILVLNTILEEMLL